MSKKIAICLYGQPRDYNTGYKIYKKLMDDNSEYEFGVFYHTWFDENKDEYEVNYFRDIPLEERLIDKDLKNNLENLYKPKKCIYERPIDFDLTQYKNLLILKNTEKYSREYYNKNRKNILSQIYSRNKSRDILNDYIDETGNYYEFVVFARFDFKNIINIRFNELDNKYIYMCNGHKSRLITHDNFMIFNQEDFLNIFNITNNWNNLFDNIELKNHMESIDEKYVFNTEEIITISIIYNNCLDKIIRTGIIPNFM